MTAALLSLALVFTPAPLQAPKETPTWPSSPVHAMTAVIEPTISYSASTTMDNLMLDPVWFVEIVSPAPIEPPPLPPPTDRELVDAIFGWPGAQLVQCESRWDRWAVGRAGERGLFQIHPLWIPEIRRLGWTWDSMFEAEPNIRMAAHIRRVQGLRAWTCWKG